MLEDKNVLSIKRITTLLLVVSLGACARGASMRIDVEVYKGPLSKTVAVQEQELSAQLWDAAETFQGLCERATPVLHPFGYVDASVSEENAGARRSEGRRDLKAYGLKLRGDSGALVRGVSRMTAEATRAAGQSVNASIEAEHSANRAVAAAQRAAADAEVVREGRRCGDFENEVAAIRSCKAGCSIRDEALDDLAWAQGKAWGLSAASTITATGSASEVAYALDSLRKIAEYGAQLRARATYWGAVREARNELSDPERLIVDDMTQFFAEIGNQIVARSDALLWQKIKDTDLYGEFSNGHRLNIAQRLSTGIYLRDSNATAYQNIYDWNRNTLRHEPRGELSSKARARMAEELMRDTYWSKINTVHASGMGEVRMAFIKDDIGNWNLKNFSNQPGELLNAFNNLARSAMSEAIGLASGRRANPEEASKFLALSNRALAGQPEKSEPKVGNKTLDDLAKRVAERIEIEKGKLEADLIAPEEAKKAAQKGIDDNTVVVAAREAEIKKLQAEIDDVSPNDGADQLRRDACKKPEAGAAEEEVDAAPAPGIPACERLPFAIREKDAAAEEIERGKISLAAADQKITALETAALKRARQIVSDHRAVVTALHDSVTPSSN